MVGEFERNRETRRLCHACRVRENIYAVSVKNLNLYIGAATLERIVVTIRQKSRQMINEN